MGRYVSLSNPIRLLSERQEEMMRLLAPNHASPKPHLELSLLSALEVQLWFSIRGLAYIIRDIPASRWREFILNNCSLSQPSLHLCVVGILHDSSLCSSRTSWVFSFHLGKQKYSQKCHWDFPANDKSWTEWCHPSEILLIPTFFIKYCQEVDKHSFVEWKHIRWTYYF